MVWKVSAAVVALALAVGVSAFAATSATTNVAVTAGKPSEFHFTLSKRSVKKGTVVFKVTNRGTISHDFKIAGKKTKLLTAGSTTTLKTVFKKAGKYKFLCTVPSHAEAGMRGVLTVK